MLIKIYALFWVMLITVTGILSANGMINEYTITILGLLFSTLFFTGLIGVLPWEMDRHYARHISKEPPFRKPGRRSARVKGSAFKEITATRQAPIIEGRSFAPGTI